MLHRNSRLAVFFGKLSSFAKQALVLCGLSVLCFGIYSYTRAHNAPVAYAAAGISHQINFQGKLVNTNGTNVTNGSYTVVFSIYTVASGGSAVWTETQTPTVTDGIFQVNLGSVTPLPGSVDFNTDNIYLGIKVGADAEMTPRIQFTSVPQAFNAEKLGGLDKTGFIQNGTGLQASSNFHISGNGTADTSLTTPLLQNAGTLNITATGANVINFNTNGSTRWSITSAGILQSTGAQTLQTSTGQLTLGTGGGNGNVVVAPNGSGDLVVNTDADTNVQITATAAPAVDQLAITNAGQAVTTAGVNALSINYVGGSAAIESSAERIDLQPGGTTGGTWSAIRLVHDATGPANGVVSQGVKLEGPTTGGAGTYNAINIANIGATTTGGTVRGINITGTNSQTAGTVRGIQLNNLTAGAASEIGIDLGTGWDSLLTYNNGATVLINGSGQWNLAQVTGTLAAGNGGTGNNTYTVGDLLYASAATTLSRLADVAVGSCLRSGGVGVAPAWGSCSSSSDITGSGTSGQVAYFNGTQTLTSSANLLFDGTNMDVAGTLTAGTGNAFQVAANGAVTAVGVNFGTGALNGTGGGTVSGAFSINTTGAANTTIGNSAGGIITIGAATGSDLALQDANWSVTGAGDASFNSVSVSRTGGIALQATSTYTSATATENYGAQIAGNFNIADTGLKQGLRVNATAGNTTGTINNLIGGLFLTKAGGNGGTVASADGLFVRNDSSTGATITNSYGVHVYNGLGAGTVGAQYGLYVDSLTKGSTNYSIYTGSAQSYFGGNLTVAAASGTGLTFSNTGLTNDIQLQNGETIDNDTDNQINYSFGAANGTLQLTSATQATIKNSAGTLNINPAGGTLASTASTFTASSLATLTTAATLSMGSTSTLNLASNATINGGTAANDDLTLQGTSNATRTTSYILLQPNGGNVGIGTATPNTALDINGSISRAQNTTRIYKNIYAYNISSSNQTGTIVLTAPKGATNTMLRFTIKGYDYSGNGAWEVVVGGYSYGTGPAWINTSAEIRGSAPFSNVRLAYDASNNAVILLGTTSTVWQYPKVVLEEIIAGHASVDDWGGTWTGSLVTSEAAYSVITNPVVNSPFTQGGNTFGAQAMLGTNDSNSLAFETNNTTRFIVSASASTLSGQGTTTVDSTGSLTLSATNAALALQTVTGGNITVTPALAAGLVNILTGNLKVGNGTPSVALNGEDAYIEGTLEVDGSTRFDGTLTFGNNAIATDITLQNGEGIDNDTDNQINYSFGAANGVLKLTSATSSTIANSAGNLNLTAVGGSTITLGSGSNLSIPLAGTSRIELGTTLSAQKLNLYESGNTRYGFGLAGGVLRTYAGAGGVISFGSVSTVDGSTYTEVARFDAQGEFNIGGDTDADALFTVGSTSQFQVNSSGDITTSANEALIINTGNNGVGASGAITLATGTGTTSSGSVTINTGNASAGTAGAISIDNGTSTSGTSTLSVGTANSRSITIGNTTAATALTLNAGTTGGITVNGLVSAASPMALCLSSNKLSYCDSTNTTGRPFLQGGNSFGSQAVLGTNDSNSLAFRTNNTNRLVLDTSGNLQFQQASSITTSSGALTLQPNAGSNVNIALSGTGSFAVNTNQLFVESTGNVGIGTTAPTEALHVVGGNIKIGARTDGETAFTKVSAATAGTINTGGTSAIDKARTFVEFNGSLYLGTEESNAAQVYRYNGSTGSWTVINTTAGALNTGDRTNIDGIRKLFVYNGDLYATTKESAAAEVYRYNGGTGASVWTRVATAASLGGGNEGESFVIHQGTLYVGTRETNGAQVFRYDGDTTWTAVSTAGNLCGSSGDDAISSLVSYNGSIWGGSDNSLNARICRYSGGGTTWTSVNGATAGDIGPSVIAATAMRSLVVYNGDLYAGTDAVDAGGVYRYDADNNWARVLFTDGQFISGDTANIDQVRHMTVYNGYLYAGTEVAGDNQAEVYRYNGGTSWTKVSNATAGTIVGGDTTAIGEISDLIPFNGSLYAGTFESNAAEVYQYTYVEGQSYALKFNSASDNAGSTEQAGFPNDASIYFMSELQASNNSGSANTGQFVFSHTITTSNGAYDLAEDYPTRDDTLRVADIVGVDTSEQGLVKKADTPGKLMGVYSSNPALRLGQKGDTINGARAIPVALTGRVPVRVNGENGPIAIGDRVTLSSVPGVGAKAVNAGQIIGIAISAFGGNGEGTIIISVSPTYWAPPISETLQAQAATFGSLQINGNATITNLTVTGHATLANLSVTGDAEIEGTLTVTGDVEVANLYVNGKLISKGEVPQIAPGAGLAGVLGASTTVNGTDTAGTLEITIGANVPTNEELANVAFTSPYAAAPRIVISGNNKKSAKLGAYVIRTETGFKVFSDDPLEPNTTYSFDYIIVQTQNP